MATARAAHVAVLLDNGLVLIAGGYNRSGALALAELYDPATRSFRATGSMTHARSAPTATKLLNGKILIAGGAAETDLLASAELYDPARGTFTATGSMNQPRTEHTATLLSDGRVLIVGGSDVSSQATGVSTEIYDPATGTFSATGSLNTGRYNHTATRLADGRVLVAGGYNASCAPRYECSSAELYDPATGRFTSTGSMARGRDLHSATLLADGRVLIAGGKYDEAPVVQAELYDPATGRFGSSDEMAGIGRFEHAAVTLADGRIMMIGGSSSFPTGSPVGLATAEIFWSPTDGFKVAASMAQARVDHTATLLPDGRVLVVGGVNGPDFLTTAEIYRD